MLLAFVAMAQALVVITAGIDVSVGMICVLGNCAASYIVVGSFGTALLGSVGVLVLGLACGALNGLIVIFGRLQPIVTTIADRLDLLRHCALSSSRSRRAPRTSTPTSPT